MLSILIATNWPNTVLLVAGVVVGLGTIWAKAVKPIAKMISQADETYPLVVDMTKYMKGVPDVFRIVSEMAAQFRTDGGSSLRDVINALTRAAEEQKHHSAQIELSLRETKVANEVIKVQQVSLQLLADQDRAALARLLIAVDRLTGMADLTEQRDHIVARNRQTLANDLVRDRASDQSGREDVASGLMTDRASDQSGRDDIASDLVDTRADDLNTRESVAAHLEARHRRAESAEDGESGQAADASMLRPKEERP